MTIYVDGGVKDNYMYIGILSTSKSHPIKFSKKLGIGATHTAEEDALFHCIQLLSSLNIKEQIVIHCDQVSIVNILNKNGITAKALKTFPRIQEIKNFITNHNIEVKWIRSKDNLAHTLINDAYNGIFYNDVYAFDARTSPKIIPNNEVDTICYINILQKELAKKDLIIKDLMKIISKLNNSTATI